MTARGGPAARRFRALVCDVGGVLTTPLLAGFAAFQDHAGVPLEAVGRAVAAVTEEDGANPRPRARARADDRGATSWTGSAARCRPRSAGPSPCTSSPSATGTRWAPTRPCSTSPPASAAAGYRTALLTNNVREWEPRWRAIFAVDELFEVVVDSAFVGLRKPDPAIYRLTLRAARPAG